MDFKYPSSSAFIYIFERADVAMMVAIGSRHSRLFRNMREVSSIS